MSEEKKWEPIYDYENESPYVRPNRIWNKYKPADIPKTIKFDPISINDYIRQVSEDYPNNVAIYFVPTDKKYTYRDVFWYADKISNGLYNELGVKKGSSVAIMTSNRPEFIFSIFGITQCGAAATPINPLLKESDVVHIVRDAGNINTVFCHSDNYRTIKRAREKVEIENVILLGALKPKGDAILFEDFVKDKEPKPPKVEIDPLNDIAALLYTGGTTGLPKGVMLTHNNLIADALCTMGIAKNRYEEEIGKIASVTVLPICHTFGFEVVIISLSAAAMMIMYTSFDAGEILRAIETYKLRGFVGVPVMFQMLVNHPDFTKRDLSSLESAGSGSAALPPEISRRWEEVTGVKMGQGYGLTEASPITHTQPEWLPEKRVDSIGVPIIDTDAKIVDPATLEELPSGQVGEMLIKGPQIMKGYWKKPEATAKTITPDGWLRTGDLARMAKDGYFYIEGRTKDMVKYKGYKVMPREVEEKLYEHPAVLEVGVVGVPDPVICETIKAFIVLRKAPLSNHFTS
ncbi:MAG: AMP-binding protein [Candidatus Hodarchaeota archaeon]